MSASLFSPSWYRVAPLKPRLRPHIQLHRQVFRFGVWYVLQDSVSGRFHRFSPDAYFMTTLMNGERSMDEIWELACEKSGDDPPSQDETIQLLSRLHGADAVLADVPPDLSELSRRSAKSKRAARMQRVKNPLAIRIPLIDPDRFLGASMPFLRPLFSPLGVVLWLTVVLAGAMAAILNWAELTENAVDRIISAQNLIVLFLCYPIVKAVHELGHGYAAKHAGAEVHDIGVMFLVLMPVPYVDASESTAFPNKWRRALVGAAGILVEVFLAGLAAIVWSMLEPGLLRAFFFNVMLIAGVSTVLFNGNPLLRFDGYYVLSDLVEIPNLGPRSNQYLLYVIKRHVFGMTRVQSPAHTENEKGWLAGYGVAALLYRLFIAAAIILFVASKFFFIGVLLAMWSMVGMLFIPAVKFLWFLSTSPELGRQRSRATALTGAAAALVLLVLFVLPAPQTTSAQGVVWVPEKSQLRAGADGFLTTLHRRDGETVQPAERLMTFEDPLLAARVRILEAQRAELVARHEAALVEDRVLAGVTQERIEQLEKELSLARRRAAELIVTAPGKGTFHFPEGVAAEGQFLRKGDMIGFVVGENDPLVRVVIDQAQVRLLKERIENVSIRMASEPGKVLTATIEREVPAASDSLPSLALSTAAGGRFYLDPTNTEEGERTIEALFQLDLRLPAGQGGAALGERAYIRFDHGNAPLGPRLVNAVRRLLMAEFDV